MGEEEIPVGASSLKGNLLHKMFARKMIQDLEEQEVEDDTDVKDIITRLAEKYQLLSKYTSFVAVDSKQNKSSLAMKSRSVPNQIPNGFHGGNATYGYNAYAAPQAYAPASYSVNRNRNRNKVRVRGGGP